MFIQIHPSDIFPEHGAPFKRVDGLFFTRQDEPGIVYRFSRQGPFIKVEHLWMQVQEDTLEATHINTLVGLFLRSEAGIETVEIDARFKALEADIYEVIGWAWTIL